MWLFLPLCFYNLIPSAFYLTGNSLKLAKDNSLSGLSTLSWISLPLPPLIHLSYSVLMTSQRRNHLLPHHFSAGTPTFRGVKSASLCHHSQNMVILELDPWLSDPLWRQTIHSTYLLRRIFLWLHLSSSMMQPKGSCRAVWKHLAPWRKPTIRRISSWIYIQVIPDRRGIARLWTQEILYKNLGTMMSCCHSDLRYACQILPSSPIMGGKGRNTVRLQLIPTVGPVS